MHKLLIVEDDLILVQMYEIAFKHAGYEVATAFDGEQGIEKMRSFKPDLTILDILMPKLSGLEVLQKMQTEPALKHIPVIVLTNLDGEKNVKSYLDQGAIGYLIKSELNPDQIVARAKELFASHKPTQ